MGGHEGRPHGETMRGPHRETTQGGHKGARGETTWGQEGATGATRGATRGGGTGRGHKGEAMRGEVCLGTTEGSGRAEPGHTSCSSWSPAGGSERAARVSEGCPRLQPGHSTGGEQTDAQRYLETCPPTATFRLRAPGVRPRMSAGDADARPPQTSSCYNFGQRWRWWLKIQESA